MSSIANNAGRYRVQAPSSYFRDFDSIQEELEEALGGSDEADEFQSWSPLLCACYEGRLEDVRVLVEGHDVEKTGMLVDEMVSKRSDRYSWTPLEMAAAKEQFEIVQFLVKTCPEVDLIGYTNGSGNGSGWGCLHWAARNSTKNVQTLQCLIDNYNGNIKDIINQKHKLGGTP